jgi:hypothetical protein
MRADDDDSTGLPPDFEYLDPPPGWPPLPSPEQLKLMAHRLQEHLERESYQARRRKWLEAINSGARADIPGPPLWATT